MQNHEMLSAFIEQIEKEIWHIVKKVIPELKEELLSKINGAGLDKINEVIEKITECQSNLSSLKTRLDAVESGCASNTTIINNHSEKIENISSMLSSASAEISKLSSDLADANNLITSTRASIAEVSQRSHENADKIDEVKTSLSSLQETLNSTRASIASVSQRCYNNEDAIAALSAKLPAIESAFEEVKDIPSQFASVKDGVETNKNDIFIVATQVKENMNNIKAINATLTELSAKVATLTSYDLLYDMSSLDPEINHGLTSGFGAPTTLDFDFDAYRYLRVFAVVNGSEGIIDLWLHDRVKNDYSIIVCNTITTSISLFKVSVVPRNKKVQPTYLGIYTWDTADAAFKLTYRGLDPTKAYIHRIEAYK